MRILTHNKSSQNEMFKVLCTAWKMYHQILGKKVVCLRGNPDMRKFKHLKIRHEHLDNNNKLALNASYPLPTSHTHIPFDCLVDAINPFRLFFSMSSTMSSRIQNERIFVNFSALHVWSVTARSQNKERGKLGETETQQQLAATFLLLRKENISFIGQGKMGHADDGRRKQCDRFSFGISKRKWEFEALNYTF